jgi:hypothetical protein
VEETTFGGSKLACVCSAMKIRASPSCSKVLTTMMRCRPVISSFSDDDIMTMGARAHAHAFYDPRGPIAIVATSVESISNMHRFMNLAAGKRPIRLFVAVEDARA